MKRRMRMIVRIVLAVSVVMSAGCNEVGIGMQVPHSGARWSGPGPDVMVGGGPR